MAANTRPRLHEYDRCRDQVIEWIEGCLAVPGSFAVSHLNGQKILDLLRKVPREESPNPFRSYSGKRAVVQMKDGWKYTGTMTGRDNDFLYLGAFVLPIAEIRSIDTRPEAS